MDLTGAGGKTGKFEFFFEDVESENVGLFLGIAGDFLEAGQSVEEVLKDARRAMDEAGLTQREQEEFEAKFSLVVEISNELLSTAARAQTSAIARARTTRLSRAEHAVSPETQAANRFTTSAKIQELISRAGMQ